MVPIAHLLLATVFIELGSSLQGLLIPIRAQLEGFSTEAIGGLGTAYYAGFALGCVIVPRAVRRVGHIRAFAGFSSVAAAALLAHVPAPGLVVWLALRDGTGFCFAALFMAVESWLNERASAEMRGCVMAICMTKHLDRRGHGQGCLRPLA
jgi:MFS family permease